MNKMTKAAVAGAAGIALLLGGAGSLALWNANAAIDGIEIATGSLTMSVTNSDVDAPALWVPGDEGTYTAEMTITAAGDNIAAALTVDEGSILGESDLADNVDLTLVISNVSGPEGFNSATGAVSAAGSWTFGVTVTVAFDEDSDNSTQVKSVDLTDLQFLLTQIAP